MEVLIQDQGGAIAPSTNLGHGGQQGAIIDPSTYESTAGYVPQPLIAVLISAPGAFRYLDDEKRKNMTASLKKLIEVHATEIEGITATVTNEFAETQMGHTEMMEHFTASQIERSVPSFTWPALKNNAIASYWTEHSRLLLENPYSKTPGIAGEPGWEAGQQLMPEDRAFTVLFIEPDETREHVVKAYLISNMMPKTGGEWTSRLSMGEAPSLEPVTVEFTGTQLVRNDVVNQMGKAYLDEINIKGLKSLDLKATVAPGENQRNAAGVSANVEAVEGNKEKANALANSV